MVKNCEWCGIEIIRKRGEYCSRRCWYEKNRGKILRRRREYYQNNKERLKKERYEHFKRTNYAYERTPKQKYIRIIKGLTRYYYPITNQKCFKCGNQAEEHHHTTEPIEIDKFEYVCIECHKKIPKKEIPRTKCGNPMVKFNELKGGMENGKSI